MKKVREGRWHSLRRIYDDAAIWIFISIAATVWGVHWFSFPWLARLVKWVAHSDDMLLFAVCITLAGLFISISEIRSCRKSVLWPVLLTILAVFWMTYWLMGCDLGRLKGVFLIFFALCVIYVSYRRIPAPMFQQRPLEDELGRKTLYTNTIRLIRLMLSDDDPMHPGKCIAIFGRWGSGKSHFMDYCAAELSHTESVEKEYPKELCRRAFRVVSVDVWNCKTGEETWENIVNAIYYVLSGRAATPKGFCRQVLHRTGNLFRVPMLPLLTTIINFIFHDSSMVEDEVKVLNERLGLEKGKSPVLLILENMDRCSVEIVLSLFPILEKLRRIKGLIVVCILAKDDFMMSLPEDKRDYKTLQGYFDKSFDFMLELPPPSKNMIQQYFCSQVTKQNGTSSRCPLLVEMAKENIFDFDTPRQAKRAAALLSSLEFFYLLRITAEKNLWLRERVCLCCELIDSFYGQIHNELIVMNEPDEFVKNLPHEFLTDASNAILSPSLAGFCSAHPVLVKLLQEERLLRSILLYLKEQLNPSQKMLSYALHKDYIILGEATDSECDDIIRNKSKETKSCREAVSLYYKGKVTEKGMQTYYMRVFEYALHHAYNAYDCVDYINRVLDENSLDNEESAQFKYNYFQTHRLLLAVLDVMLKIGDANSGDRRNIGLNEILKKILNMYTLNPVCDVVEIILKCHDNRYGIPKDVEDFPELRALRERHVYSDAEIRIFEQCGYLLTMWLRKESTYKFRGVSPFLYDIDNRTKEYYMSGVEQYRRQYIAKQGYHLSAVQRMVANLLSIMEDAECAVNGFADIFAFLMKNDQSAFSVYRHSLFINEKIEKLHLRLLQVIRELSESAGSEGALAQLERERKKQGLSELLLQIDELI